MPYNLRVPTTRCLVIDYADLFRTNSINRTNLIRNPPHTICARNDNVLTRLFYATHEIDLANQYIL